MQQLIFPRWWEYADGFLDVRKKLDQYQKVIFQEVATIEDKVIEYYRQKEIEKADLLLTNYTYEKLQENFKKINDILSDMETNVNQE